MSHGQTSGRSSPAPPPSMEVTIQELGRRLEALAISVQEFQRIQVSDRSHLEQTMHAMTALQQATAQTHQTTVATTALMESIHTQLARLAEAATAQQAAQTTLQHRLDSIATGEYDRLRANYARAPIGSDENESPFPTRVPDQCAISTVHVDIAPPVHETLGFAVRQPCDSALAPKP